MTLWLAYAKAGKEFEVMEALSDIGVTAHCAKQVEIKRVGKRRRPDAFVTPLLSNYLFIDCTADQYLDVVATKHLAGTMMAVPLGGDTRSALRFVSVANAEFDARMAKIDAGERLEQFAPGDALKVLDGPLAGLTARFRGIIEGAVFPSIAADVEMMGQTVRATLDPLYVAAE